MRSPYSRCGWCGVIILEQEKEVRFLDRPNWSLCFKWFVNNALFLRALLLVKPLTSCVFSEEIWPNVALIPGLSNTSLGPRFGNVQLQYNYCIGVIKNASVIDFDTGK